MMHGWCRSDNFVRLKCLRMTQCLRKNGALGGFSPSTDIAQNSLSWCESEVLIALA